jgi:hypothetical protein
MAAIPAIIKPEEVKPAISILAARASPLDWFIIEYLPDE